MTSLWGSLFLGSFLNEDLSLIASIVLYYKDTLSLFESTTALFFGIILSDFLFFGLGRLSQKYFSVKIIEALSFKIKNYYLLYYFIYVSRAVPFLRLPTFYMAGLSNIKWSDFLKNLVFSIFAWLLLSFLLGRSMQKLVTYSRPMFAFFIIATIAFFHLLMPKIISKLKNS